MPSNDTSLLKPTSYDEKQSLYAKRILIVDDDPDITFTFKKGLEESNRASGSKISFRE